MDIIDQILASQSFRRLATAIKTHNAPDVVKLWRSTTQSIPSGVITPVNFDTAVHLSDTALWSIANPSKIFIRHSGIYFAVGHVGWETSAASYRTAYIRINGNNNNTAVISIISTVGVVGQVTRHSTGAIEVYFNAGDFIELAVMHGVPSTLNLESFAPPPLTPYIPVLYMRGPL